MGDDTTGTSPALNTQLNPELKEHIYNTKQNPNYVKTQSPFIPHKLYKIKQITNPTTKPRSSTTA